MREKTERKLNKRKIKAPRYRFNIIMKSKAPGIGRKKQKILYYSNIRKKLKKSLF